MHSATLTCVQAAASSSATTTLVVDSKLRPPDSAFVSLMHVLNQSEHCVKSVGPSGCIGTWHAWGKTDSTGDRYSTALQKTVSRLLEFWLTCCIFLTGLADEALDTVDVYKNGPQDFAVVKMCGNFRSEAPYCVHFCELQ